MASMRILLFATLFGLAAFPVRAAEEADDWKMIGGFLALVQQVVHLAANSPDPDAARRHVDGILAGESAQANRIAAGVLEEVLQDVPAEQRGAFVAIGRDLLTLARREQARTAAQPPMAAQPSVAPETSREGALQARRDLHAMGLRYWDEQQFLEAVRRGDRIAVDLFMAARGLESKNPPPAR
jgi:hypothetical protein